MNNLNGWYTLAILAATLLAFGAKVLPALAKGAARSLRFLVDDADLPSTTRVGRRRGRTVTHDDDTIRSVYAMAHAAR